MRLNTSWLLGSALGALWLASCSSSDDAQLFSPIASGGAGPNAGGSNQNSGATSKAGGDSGGTNGGGAGIAGTDSSGGSGAGAGTDSSGGSGGAGGSGMAGRGGAAGSSSGGAAGGNGGGGGLVVSRSCKSDSNCEDREYCAKTLCFSPMGICTEMPESCPSAPADLRCGCDGVTYFEPCLAALNGVNLAGAGVCGESEHIHCDGDNQCPDREGSTCVDLESSCFVERDPECWVLPEACPEVEPASYQRCGGQTDECVGLCEGAAANWPISPANACN